MAGKKGPRSARALEAAAARKAREQQLRNIFARRLEAARIAKGWNMSELAREASRHLPTPKRGQKQGKGVTRDLISNYTRAKMRPRPEYLEAIAKALDMTREELMPSSPGAAPPPDQFPAMTLNQQEDGRAWIRLNRALSMPAALAIIEIVQKEDNPAQHSRVPRRSGT
jgi:transcriptional regulator with XRE-family HTH domain